MTETVQYEQEKTTRASERFSDVLPAAYDEKDNMDLLRQKLAQRKKPIYAGLAFMCLVVIGVTVIVASSGSTEASTGSAQQDPVQSAPAPAPAPQDAGAVHAADGDSTTAGSLASAMIDLTSASGSGVSAGSGSLEGGVIAPNKTEEPTAEPTGPIYPYKLVDFDFMDMGNWQYSDGAPVPPSMFAEGGIKMTPANSKQPIYTKQGWPGEKIVFVEWERSPTSDTNIWMLNTALRGQFAKDNGWPRLGELDIFEMFTQDRHDKRSYDFSGFGPFSDVASYGQLTMHKGAEWGKGPQCFCPASPSKSQWFEGASSMVSGCGAQFANSPKNSIATVFGTDGNGQFIQLHQYPVINKGGKINGEIQTYDVTKGSGVSTKPVYNNARLFWGSPANDPCAAAGGHNPATGFPFFENFRLVLEEQMKGDGSAWFKVTNVMIFVKA